MASTLDLTGDDYFYEFRLLPGGNPRFWPRWAAMNRPYMVLATYDTSWTVTPHPGTNSHTTDDTSAATFVWTGGSEHSFTDPGGLVTALSSAGYTAETPA